MRVGLVGCGDVASKQHLPALMRDQRIEVVAVADTNLKRAHAIGEQYGISNTRSTLAEILTLDHPDAVVVATPPQVTWRLAIEAVSSGVHVLCEKPIATTISHAQTVVAAVEGSDRILQVGYKNRFAPLVRQMRRWVDAGRLGGPIVARIAVFDEALDRTDIEHTRRITDFLAYASPMVHDGSHQVDLLMWMWGSPMRISAYASKFDRRFPNPNYHVAVLDYGEVGLVTLEVGWLWPGMLPGQFHLLGPDASIEIDRENRSVCLDDGRHREVVTDDEDFLTSAFRNQLDGFIRACEGEPQEGATAREASDVLEMTLAIVAASHTGSEAEFT